MGQSYGSLLGLTYAALFPTHIRAMVLDSVIDPALSFDQITLGQAEGFEQTLNAFFAWCAGSAACPWHPGSDPTAALLTLLNTAATAPAPAGAGSVAGVGQLYDAVLDSLYSQSQWPQLGAALAADAADNGAPVVALSNHYNTGGSTNADDAAIAVDCLDHPVSRHLATYGALVTSLAASAPVFGPLLAWGEAGCAVWPVRPTRTVGPVAAPGSPPILVVGTTNDPATPYAWAVNVAKELDHGVLLTHDGDDHVAYFHSACVSRRRAGVSRRRDDSSGRAPFVLLDDHQAIACPSTAIHVSLALRNRQPEGPGDSRYLGPSVLRPCQSFRKQKNLPKTGTDRIETRRRRALANDSSGAA